MSNLLLYHLCEELSFGYSNLLITKIKTERKQNKCKLNFSYTNICHKYLVKKE